MRLALGGSHSNLPAMRFELVGGYLADSDRAAAVVQLLGATEQVHLSNIF